MSRKITESHEKRTELGGFAKPPKSIWLLITGVPIHEFLGLYIIYLSVALKS